MSANTTGGELTFQDCWRYRIGPTNDEGWYKGQCRFSRIAPQWGKFYEVSGDLRLERVTLDWIVNAADVPKVGRHFLFYFRDETFECDATSWSFRVLRVSDADAERFRAASRTITLPKYSLVELMGQLFSAPFWAVRDLLRRRDRN